MRICIVTVVIELRGQCINRPSWAPSPPAARASSYTSFSVVASSVWKVVSCVIQKRRDAHASLGSSKLEPRDNSTQQNPNAAPSAGDDPYALSLCAHETWEPSSPASLSNKTRMNLPVLCRTTLNTFRCQFLGKEKKDSDYNRHLVGLYRTAMLPF
jgi:hypothetical protein